MVVCRYLGRACVEIISDKDHIIIDPNYVEVPRKGINKILLTHEHDDHLSLEKIQRIYENFVEEDNELKIFAPISIKDKIKSLKLLVIKDESIIKLGDGNIEVFSINCWNSKACVAYLINVNNKSILHTTDSAYFSDRLKNIGKKVDCCFVATFEDYYEDYLNFIRAILPKLTIPYHFSPGKEKMGKKLAAFLEKNEVNVKYLEPGKDISL
ncbi:MAG: MBL fold metallo-hydrolase [Candidatus Lokiarchaeota archaeon]